MSFIICLACIFGSVQAYPETQLLAFEAASIKPQPWTNEGGVQVFVRGNTLRGEHVDLYRLIEFAYGLRTDDTQVSGGPAWALHGNLYDSDLYQVVAKAPEGPPPPLGQFKLMLQALLADRFQLKIHHAKKDLPIFNLVVARDGPKLRENTSDVKASMAMRGGKMFRIRAVHVPMANLVEQLGFAARRPVFDRTGLTGFYDFEIDWTADEVGVAGPDAIGPSVFTAVRERLGLRLEPAIAPFDTVVIDHASKPSGN